MRWTANAASGGTDHRVSWSVALCLSGSGSVSELGTICQSAGAASWGVVRMWNMDEQQRSFLKDEFFNCTIRGAFQRARVYTAEAKDNGREGFRKALRSSLEQLEAHYREPVEDEDHIRNIEILSSRLSIDHAKVLVAGRFRIGVAQKALNLYLKYLWCIGGVSTPPHCPFYA